MAQVEFHEDTHTYTLDNEILISVTTLMRKHNLAPDYSDVAVDTLKRKADYGKFVHSEIHTYNTQSVEGFSKECANYIAYMENNPQLEIIGSEMLVHNDLVAGQMDLLLREDGVLIPCDHKTTAVVHEESVSWQLSIYLFLHLKGNREEYEKSTYGLIFHYNREGELNVIKVPLKKFSKVESLIECERIGTLYVEENELATREQMLLSEVYEIESFIKSVEETKKKAEAKQKELKQALIKAMEESGQHYYENEDGTMKISYVKPYTKETLDTARLKKEHQDIYEQYKKTSNVSASVKIKIEE